jgi:shikimate dehydrogenase
LSEEIIQQNVLIINTSPVGMYPNINEYPNIPYQFLSDKHYLFDLIYNPSETTFLKKGKEFGATIKNGHEMLIIQAEESWRIWNDG